VRIWIWDIVAVVVVVFSAVSAYRRGFLRSLVSFLGTAVSFAVAWIFSGPIAQKCYDGLLKESVAKAVQDAIAEYGTQSFESVLMRAEEILESLPNLIGDIVKSQIDADSLEIWYQNMIRASSGNIAAGLTEGVVAPIVTTVLQILAFVLLFMICSFLVQLAVGLLRGVRRMPVIGGLDSLLGGIFGVVQGMLYVFVIAAVLWLFIRLTGDGLPIIKQQELSETILFRRFFDAVTHLRIAR